MNLIIVESPTKARTLSAFLGDGYKIEASMGHVRDLPSKKLGVDVQHDFAPEYVVAPEKEGIVSKLQNLAKEAGTVILATDPDREGEAIAYHLAQVLSDNLKFRRITFHEITKLAVEAALKKPGEINMPLVDAQQARRILDRLVGYKLSPLLWRKVRKGLSAGRVQSVAVRLIVEREREVQNFKPQEYWEIIAKFKILNLKFEISTGEFEAKLQKINGKPAEIKNQTEAQEIVKELEKAEFKIAEVQVKEVRRAPYPPFTTSTMQQAAANLFGWTARKTMQIAQNLYEQGLITYHRTDSLNLAVEAVNSVRQYINSQYGGNYLPENPRYYKTKSKVAQEAHEAIRPTNTGDNGQKIRDKGLDRDQVKLYELIWKRFVACQMSEAVYLQTGVDITAGEFLLRASGNKILFEGWKKLFGKEEGDEENALPEMIVGEILQLLGLMPSQHFTEPPPRYTEASLIKILEEYGIGRPSTYAPIISTIQDRQYVEKEDKKLIPTALGFAVNDFLLANFANIMDYKFTAGMEDQLDEIANGEKKWVPVIHNFYDPFEKQLDLVQTTAERVKVAAETTDEKCPNDGAALVIRIGRFGKFLACSNFPACKFTKPLVKKLDIKCPKCDGDVVVRKTKNRKTFYGCSNYPTCDFASWTKPKVAVG